MHSHKKKGGLKKTSSSHASQLVGSLPRLRRILPRYKLVLISWGLLVAVACLESNSLKILTSEGPAAFSGDKTQLIRLGVIAFLICLSLMALLIGLDRAIERNVRLSARIKSLKRRVEISRTELDSIKEGFPIGLFLVSLQNQVRYSNAQFLSLTGLTTTEQNRKSWVESVTPEQRQRVALCWQEAFDAQLSFTELVAISCNSAQRWVRIRLVPVRVRSNVVGYLGVAVEETAHIENDELIQRLLSRIEDAQGKIDQTVESLRTIVATEMHDKRSREIRQTVVIETPVNFTPEKVPNNFARDWAEPRIIDASAGATGISDPDLGDLAVQPEIPAPKKTRRRRTPNQSPSAKPV